ncbi:unnamed protein product [Clavelina lepadiformis]|uniref:Uncharacterized protein n=1 Tax=Clavelina lepadiformis TaxID=159417 RepID=A0ABP0GIK5_CLALP
MKMEFAQLQVNIEDMVLKILAETKKTETMNNAIPNEEISQPLHVESDISINIEKVYSEKAPVFPLVEAIKQEPLLLEEYEVSQPEIDDLNISMLDKIPSQSNIGVNATVKIVKPQSCVARNSDEECSYSVEMFLNKSTASERINACKLDTQIEVKATVKVVDPCSCVETNSDEEFSDSVELFLDEPSANACSILAKKILSCFFGNN